MNKRFSLTLIILAVAVTICVALPVKAADLSEETKTRIVSQCSIIKDNLKNLQYEDSRVRVHIGRYYDAILDDFLKPLNIAMIGANLTDYGLIENQADYVKERSKFTNDYIAYQKNLEQLVSLDCKAEPAKFYKKLEEVRQNRKLVASDTATLRNLIEDQVKLVKRLRNDLAQKEARRTAGQSENAQTDDSQTDNSPAEHANTAADEAAPGETQP